MKATKEKYYKLCRCMFEATNLAYYIHKPEFDAGTNFFVNFWDMHKQVKDFVADGGIFKYNLINAGTHEKVPFIYNSLEFKNLQK